MEVWLHCNDWRKTSKVSMQKMWSRMERGINGNARAIIKKHISTKKEYIHQVEKIVDKFAGVL